ncbi:MAG: hypothetical protein RI900_1638 [Actinomycetota bacterium]
MDVTATSRGSRGLMTATRVVWLATTIVGGLALRAHSPVAAWTWWIVAAAVLAALVARGAAALTVLRWLSPLAVPAAVIAWAAGGTAVWCALTLALAALSVLLSYSAEIGETMVQGGAYGHEQRFPMRPPAALLLPMAVSWLVWAAAALAAVLMLSAGSWLPGALLVAVTGGLSWLLFRRFHRLSRRWLVLVPAGLVVHDHMVLGETLMVERTNVAAARLALADTQAADLTGPAAGHAIEVEVREMVLALLPATREHPKGKALHVGAFLVAPSRPGRALRAIAAAGHRVV